MIIPHLENLDEKRLKSQEFTLSMLLEEIEEQNLAHGVVSEKIERGEGNANFKEWLKTRKSETAKISKAIREEIQRRFAELGQRAETAEQALETTRAANHL